MTTSTVASDPIDDDVSVPQPTEYRYDLRLEIGVKSEGTTIPVVAIFRDFAQRLKAAADDDAPMVIMTAKDNIYFEHKEMTSEEFQKAFQVAEHDGKAAKVLLGFKIRTMTKLSDLKTRLMHTYLIPRNLFLRQHVGGFAHGVKTYNYGFLKDDHPDHPDISQLNQRFAKIIADAWKKLDKDERKKWKQELPNIFFGNTGIMLPINFTKERLTAALEGKGKITTNALMVSTPTKYGKLMKNLLDIALAAKRLNNLIPFALSRENPEGYYYIVAHQDRFIDNHRNIPIMKVPADSELHLGTQGKTLFDALIVNPSITRVAYDPSNRKYHISTTATKYKEVHQWITRVLREHKFPYAPHVRDLKFKNGNTSISGMSYSDIFKDTMSKANDSYSAGTEKTTKSNAWKIRPPLAISYVPTDEAFPPLSPPDKPDKPPAPVTPSMISDMFDEDTIQSAISVAISKMEEKHREELAQLKREMQSKIDEVATQMKDLGQQVAMQTYQALVKEESPLVTKTDHAHLQHEMNIMTTQLSTLISMFQTNSTALVLSKVNNPVETFRGESPERQLKRPNCNRTPEKPDWHEEPLTQPDCLNTSATSNSEESMGGRED